MLGTTDPLQEDLFEWTGLLRDVINWETRLSWRCIRSPGKELKALVKVLERLAQWCKVLATLAEDQNSISSTHTVVHNRLQLQFQVGAASWPIQAGRSHVHKHTCRQNTHKYILKDSLKTFVSSQPWMLGIKPRSSVRASAVNLWAIPLLPFPCFDTGFYGIRLAWSSLWP